jgi:uncharacterized membrane protein
MLSINCIIHFKGDKPSAVDDLELRTIEERDKEMQHLVEKHPGKKRQESLLEAHQKELKRKKKVRIDVQMEACLSLRLVFKLSEFIFCFKFI